MLDSIKKRLVLFKPLATPAEVSSVNFDVAAASAHNALNSSQAAKGIQHPIQDLVKKTLEPFAETAKGVTNVIRATTNLAVQTVLSPIAFASNTAYQLWNAGPSFISRVVLIACDYAGIPFRKISEKASGWENAAQNKINAKHESANGLIDRFKNKILSTLRIK
ncbi:hypothetical protein COU74_00730 [Candidatus Peregrinibacteria bacterium CG10_big_fil_rev_8_21_14_0_10_36_19]|nr:MAG: hypothetical protein COU74_00730 [Candidatus Peregrinibacteria bacterium CG10_big_fil_rev_8_21_14_0_10_36_19]